MKFILVEVVLLVLMFIGPMVTAGGLTSLGDYEESSTKQSKKIKPTFKIIIGLLLFVGSLYVFLLHFVYFLPDILNNQIL